MSFDELLDPLCFGVSGVIFVASLPSSSVVVPRMFLLRAAETAPFGLTSRLPAGVPRICLAFAARLSAAGGDPRLPAGVLRRDKAPFAVTAKPPFAGGEGRFGNSLLGLPAEGDSALPSAVAALGPAVTTADAPLPTALAASSKRLAG